MSCSGLALQSIIMNDPNLAKMTNLLGGFHDLYTLIGDTLKISGGNSVIIPSSADGTGTDDQSLSFAGNTLSIEGANNVDLSGLDQSVKVSVLEGTQASQDLIIASLALIYNVRFFYY
jgi:hypothetical protein